VDRPTRFGAAMRVVGGRVRARRSDGDCGRRSARATGLAWVCSGTAGVRFWGSLGRLREVRRGVRVEESWPASCLAACGRLERAFGAT